MSNSTPKRGLSGLISRFLRSDSDESSSSSSADNEEQSDDSGSDLPEASKDISPLAMMSENSPEAWLGQFLLQLDLSTSRHSLAGAQADAELKSKLEGIRQVSAGAQPLKLLDEAYAADLRKRDWSAWWKGQDELSSYCYATLALGLLGNRQYAGELGAMYHQSANSRIHKHAHYVLCNLLSKPWPSYKVTQNDLARLGAES